MKHVLFVCEGNLHRSPTAEQLYSTTPEIKARSAGLSYVARTQVTEELLDWADVVYLGNRGLENVEDLNVLPIQSGDQILLCTDGAYAPFSGLYARSSDEETLIAVLQTGTMQERVDRLIKASLDHGTKDNTTALLINVETDVSATDAKPESSRTFKPELLRWNEGTLVKMAETIVNENRWYDLPILADALEDAGCDNSAMVTHLREVDDHVPECWALRPLITPTSGTQR